MRMKTFTIQQSGNRVEIHGTPSPLFYELNGLDLPPVTDAAFAVWHILPWAMKLGFDYHIAAPVDPVVLANAEKLTRIWEMWLPHKFRELRITAEGVPPQPPSVRGRDLTFYSGGIDSTHMLLQLGRRPEPVTAITVHGMDYVADNHAGFQGLLAKTQPLLEALNYRRITLRSNASLVAKGSHGWGMALSGHAFLLSGLFENGVFAADLSHEQDVGGLEPWGQNHVTNRYFRGRDFRFQSLCEETTRAEKTIDIVRDPLALAAASFCKDRTVRPNNCGHCVRCARAKVMFLGMTGKIPPVFIDNAYGDHTIQALKFEDKEEQMFLIDTYQHARRLGFLPLIQGLEARIDEARRNPLRLPDAA